jgi:CheY-like chemotaxis protein
VTKKILLADDSLTIQKVVELTFSDSEYELVCVSNGQRALDRIAGGDLPDLILADVVMPDKNGYEVCEAIKSNPATARIPVMLLSGTFEPFDRDRAERLGCDAIVSKPFDSQQLLRQVEALIARPAADVAVAATIAIPIMPNPGPPPSAAPAAPGLLGAESGFHPEDFSGSIRVPAQIAGGADLFEEEYGQADVESAIKAFEKAHPEYSYAEDDTPSPASAPGDAASEPERPHAAETPAAGWLGDELEPAPEPPAARFWVPRAPEPDVAPIPFSADESASRRRADAPAPGEPETMRADEAPTQQIPLSAEFASLSRSTGDSPERDTDPTAPRRAPDEQTAEIAVVRDGGVGAGSPPAEPRAAELGAVPAEIEALAQTTSIGQLKEMLSSVSRGEGGLSDDELDRLASRVVERLSERIVREIAWEVIPDVAEMVIKQRIKELEGGVE